MLRLLPRLFKHKLIVEISNDHIAVVNIAAGFNKRIIDKQYLANMLVRIPTDDDQWHVALNQLEVALANIKYQKNTVLSIVLASDFIRYLALPAHNIVMNVEEKTDYARAAYREVYGNIVDGWKIQCDDAAPNQTSIIAAIDQELFDGIVRISESNNLQLISLQPQLMPLFNRFKNELNTGDIYFSVIESGRLLFAHLVNGHFQSLRSLALNGDWQLQLESIAKREQMLVESNISNSLIVYAPAYKNTRLPTINGWIVKQIGMTTTPVIQNNHFAMIESIL